MKNYYGNLSLNLWSSTQQMFGILYLRNTVTDSFCSYCIGVDELSGIEMQLFVQL